MPAARWAAIASYALGALTLAQLWRIEQTTTVPRHVRRSLITATVVFALALALSIIGAAVQYFGAHD